MNTLSRMCAVKMGVRRIALEAAELAEIAQATLNNTNVEEDRVALTSITQHLEAVVKTAKVLRESVLAEGQN